ncbi:hypothetical protein GX48_01858 [Paracoccidioides brasiliensis]|nr:hypothetical protein GX48_01858 [Paracoccidioides brasiliensis]
MVRVPPDSSLAFDILLNFCISNSLEKEFLAGLVTFLMLTSRNVPTPQLSPLSIVSDRVVPPARRSSILQRLLEALDKCIALGSTADVPDSLLGSTFFDPRIPCTFCPGGIFGYLQSTPPDRQ